MDRTHAFGQFESPDPLHTPSACCMPFRLRPFCSFWKLLGLRPSALLQVYKRSFWTESFVQWSPKGSYVTTVHTRGVAVWGGPSFGRIQRFSHNQVCLMLPCTLTCLCAGYVFSCTASLCTLVFQLISSSSRGFCSVRCCAISSLVSPPGVGGQATALCICMWWSALNAVPPHGLA